MECVCFRSRNLPAKSNRPTDSNQWISDAENQISSFVTENLTTSAKKGLAKARTEFAKARKSITSLASKATDGLNAKNPRAQQASKAARSKAGLVSRALKASSSIWKMFSGATGAAKNIWSKATQWKAGIENRLEKDGNAKNIQDLTNLETEGRSNHGSLEEYQSWPISSDLPKEENSEQIDVTLGTSAPVVQEFVYFVPNPEAPQFVKTDFLPSPPDQTGQSQIEEENLMHTGDTWDEPAIDVFYGEKTDFVTAQAYDHVDTASPNVPGKEFDSQNFFFPASNYLAPGVEKNGDIDREAENSQLFTSFSSDLTIREPEWAGWGEEVLLPPSQLSQTRTWTGERREEDGRWELPTAEMVGQDLVAMEEEQEEDQEVKEKRIQELALQLLHDEAILAEG